MTREFVELPGFRSDWKELGMTDSDLKRLQYELLMNPEVYIDFELRERVYLLAAFAKNVQANLTKAERSNLKKLVKLLED